MISYAEARNLGENIVDAIKPLVRRIKIAGSVRRCKEKVHDVDIVLVPKVLTWPGMIANTIISELGGAVIKSGPKILSMTVQDNQVDLYYATPKNWGIKLLVLTGSKKHNIKLGVRAQRMGMSLAVSRGIIKDGEIIASETEEEIYEALKLPWIPSRERF